MKRRPQKSRTTKRPARRLATSAGVFVGAAAAAFMAAAPVDVTVAISPPPHPICVLAEDQATFTR
ncbi:hypothetical protein [Streptomyces sp. NPDC005538]|uniref:hypothetical protein n=1 Tax=unclassified Streptomyces TaxID=2593676 RepID=UPI0033A24437